MLLVRRSGIRVVVVLFTLSVLQLNCPRLNCRFKSWRLRNSEEKWFFLASFSSTIAALPPIRVVVSLSIQRAIPGRTELDDNFGHVEIDSRDREHERARARMKQVGEGGRGRPWFSSEKTKTHRHTHAHNVGGYAKRGNYQWLPGSGAVTRCVCGKFPPRGSLFLPFFCIAEKPDRVRSGSDAAIKGPMVVPPWCVITSVFAGLCCIAPRWNWRWFARRSRALVDSPENPLLLSLSRSLSSSFFNSVLPYPLPLSLSLRFFSSSRLFFWPKANPFPRRVVLCPFLPSSSSTNRPEIVVALPSASAVVDAAPRRAASLRAPRVPPIAS